MLIRSSHNKRVQKKKSKTGGKYLTCHKGDPNYSVVGGQKSDRIDRPEAPVPLRSELYAEAFRRIQDEEGIEPDQDLLFYKTSDLAKNDFSIEDYIKTAAPPISSEVQFFLKNIEGKTISLKVDRTDTIEQVKAKIHLLPNFKDFRPEDMILTYGDKTMLDDTILDQYDIDEGRTADFHYRIGSER